MTNHTEAAAPGQAIPNQSRGCCGDDCCTSEAEAKAPTPAATAPVPVSAAGDIRTVVREKYGEIAEGKRSGCCGDGGGGGCGCSSNETDVIAAIGYSAEQSAAIPQGDPAASDRPAAPTRRRVV